MIVAVELPAPGLLWTRWATLAAALSAIGYDDVWSVDDTGARLRATAESYEAIDESRRQRLLGIRDGT